MSGQKSTPAEILEQIWTNWAFEHLIVSVLTGAGFAGGLVFLFAFAGAVLAGGAISAALAVAFVKALIIAFLVFLVGFVSGVFVIAPLFRYLERSKRRGALPYVGASVAIAAAALALASNIRGAGSLEVGVAAPVLASSVVIAWLFARRMAPMWRAAARAESEAGEDVKLLH